jgi:hypothetical protein
MTPRRNAFLPSIALLLMAFAPRAEAEPDSVGLCFRCRYGRTVRGRRSLFWFCERSRTDPRFVKYPRLPVQECTGFEPKDPADPVTDA